MKTLAITLAGLLLTLPVMAQDAVPPYDGTGSASTYWLGDKPYDPADDQAAQAKVAKDAADLRKRADKGESEAMVRLAAMLEQGDLNHAVDRAGALDLYEKAATHGNVIGREKTCMAYLLGEGRPKNVNKGLDICGALGADDAAGVYSAAYDYEYGISGPKNEAMAEGLYVKAGKMGSGDALDAIGHKTLALGQAEKARDWFVQGVYLGSADAMDDLAAMTDAGQGGPKDEQEAYWLYVNAARRGNAHAAAWVAALPPDRQPLKRSVLWDKTTGYLLTKVTHDKAGVEHRESFDIGKALQRAYPAAAVERSVEGSAIIHCYINAAHRLDVCIVQHESPPGYYFGWLLSTIYDAEIYAAEKDAIGHPTEHTVNVAMVRWVIG